MAIKVISFRDKPLVKVYKDDSPLAEISLEDNGIHVSLLGVKKFVVLPSPDIEYQVDQIVEKLAEKFEDEIGYFYGDEKQMEEVGYLVLGDPWYDREKLALIASKHVAVFSNSKAKKNQTVVGVTRFLPDLIGVTVIRKEDDFPIGQVLLDYSQSPPKVKVFNELGEVNAELEGYFDLDDILHKHFEVDDSVVVYRDQPENTRSPMVVETESGVYYVTVIFRFLLAFSSGDDGSLRVPNVSSLKSSLYALLYLDRLKGKEGVEIFVHPYAVPITRLGEAMESLKRRVNSRLEKLGIDRKVISGYEPIVKSLKELRSEIGNRRVRVVPLAFLVVTEGWDDFVNYVDRIISGPVKDGERALIRMIEDALGEAFVPQLLSLEHLLFLVLSDRIE